MTTSPITITAELLDDLQRKAEAATPGAWEVVQEMSFPFGVSLVSEDDAFITDIRLAAWSTADDLANANARPENQQVFADAAHIAAANPATILALIAHIRSLTERLERAEKNSERYLFIASTCSVMLDGVEVDDECQIDAAIAQEGAENE